MLETNLKDKLMIDLWILFFGMFISPDSIANANNQSLESLPAKPMMIFIFTFIALAIIWLIYCARIEKYRYLTIYVNCKKTVPKLIVPILFLLSTVLGLVIIFYIKDLLPITYVLILCVLSFHIKKGEQ